MQGSYPIRIMSRVISIMFAVLLVSTGLFSGCTDVEQSPSLTGGQQDPIRGVWISQEGDLTTIYRFWENGTFDAWSRSVDTRPKFIYTSKGKWVVRGVHEYATEGEHIGYGEVTALAIRRILNLAYDPPSDTMTIKEYQNQVFARLSHDPDAPLDPSVSFNR